MIDGTPAAAQGRLAELRSSAKGWHGVQLAALGFIGLCGVIQTGTPAIPRSLQVLAGVLVLLAFALACAGIYSVGRAAWPLYRPAPGGEPAGDADADGAAIAVASRQLTRGLTMTFLSIAALALATATSWWPDSGTAAGSGTAAQVQVQTRDGRTACGELAGGASSGALRLVRDGRPIEVALASLASVTSASAC